MEYPLLDYWVLLCAALILKAIAQSMCQVWIRIRYQMYAVSEDKMLFYPFRAKKEMDEKKGQALLERYTKLWQNDLEGIPLFLFMALGFTLIQGDSFWGSIYFLVFAVARVAYAICYVNAIQPFRGMSWDIGFFTTIALAVHSVVTVLGRI